MPSFSIKAKAEPKSKAFAVPQGKNRGQLTRARTRTKDRTKPLVPDRAEPITSLNKEAKP